jgi:hypothetical protein
VATRDVAKDTRSVEPKNVDIIFKDLCDFTLTPLRGEGAAFGRQNYLFGQHHGYHGAHGVTRPTMIGSGAVSRSGGNREPAPRQAGPPQGMGGDRKAVMRHGTVNHHEL